MSYRLVIGLETHVQLLTRTKLFCGCDTRFGLAPNSATCPICMGLPGSLPVLNAAAFELALKAATALNCRIMPYTKWDRKNYYYPDLPKNYQISQYDLPFSRDGWLEIAAASGTKRIGIMRVHLEEDAGKMLHDEAGGGRDSLVDLNRAGTPLLEIVSRPDLSTPEEAKTYLEEMRLLLRDIQVSDCEMQEGSLRCDANVNLHIPQADGTYHATPLIEVKNLNSFRAIERAMKYEAERQWREYQEQFGSRWCVDPTQTKRFGGDVIRPVCERVNGRLRPVNKATAGWNERTERTEMQRRKEEAADYRYFPDPDLVPVTVGEADLQRVRGALGELPAARRARLANQYGLGAYDADLLVRQGRAFVAYFEAVAARCGQPKEACNWLANDLLQTLNERKTTIENAPLSAAALGDLIAEVKAMGLNKQRAREVYAVMLAEGLGAKEALAKLGFAVVADEAQLLPIIRRAIAAHPKAVADYKKGKIKAADAIKGAVMRETKGMAKMEQVHQLLVQELNNA
ncbi:MAG: Asp-tRNA(Asn)/Glu-tRNA(Gln) amidotransferase subunit GatB [Gemmataceae bacterium]|nr:Asp-tRNA(Asn)/Glu-tRNA(Gln) amidotransferase subunit GatB [Gemmataceae bacterium]